MKRLFKLFVKGLVVENPLLILMIGLCSSLAVTSSVENAIGMGSAMTFVIVFAELVISLFRKLIPNSSRIPIFIIVIAAFTTMIDLSMQAYFPDLSKSLGVFIPLIVVNCIIMGRVEAFASKERPLDAAVDALGMGVGSPRSASFWATGPCSASRSCRRASSPSFSSSFRREDSSCSLSSYPSTYGSRGPWRPVPIGRRPRRPHEPR